MAIKLKNRNNTEIIKNNSNKKNININIIAIILLVIISGGIMLFYPKLKECAKMDKTQIYEDNYFLDKIYDSSYMLYKDVLEHKKGSEISIEEAYIKEYLVDDYYQDNYYGTGSFSDESNYEDGNREITKSEVNISLDKEIEADKKNIVRNLDENYLQNKRTLQNDLRNVQYAVFDNNNNLIASNVEQDLLNIDNIKEKYDFYVELAFNKNGLADILKSHGIDEDLLSNRMSNYNYNKNETYQYNYTKASLNSISDCKFIYAIPKELKYVDYITELRTSYNEGVDQNVIMAFVGSVFVVILIVSFFLPYNKGKNIVGIRFINKIPTEINIVIYICLALSIAALCLLGLQSTLDGNAIKALNASDEAIILLSSPETPPTEESSNSSGFSLSLSSSIILAAVFLPIPTPLHRCFSSPVIIAYFKLFTLLIDNNDNAAFAPTPFIVNNNLNISSSSLESKPYNPIKSSLNICSK